MNFDDLDNHLPAAGSIDRAALPMGFYLTWCANMQLVSALLEDQAGSLLMRTRYRDARPTELLIAAAGGTLSRDLFNVGGVQFTETYYKNYLDDFADEFGGDVYAVRDDWDHYDRMARVLTRRYLRPTEGQGRLGERLFRRARGEPGTGRW